MKRIVLNLVGALVVCSTLDLQFPAVFAQGTPFTVLTITNPTPAASDSFGHAVAAAGDEWVLIGAIGSDVGASGAGAAYLFSTSGTLITSFTNPTPSIDATFGCSVAAVGGDRVLIGAFQDDTGAKDSGAAYLFSTNGALLTTFINPTPAAGDWFGRSLAAVGTDRVLFGATGDDTGASGAGAAYLFSTSGTLVTTFTNPAPGIGDFFGNSVAALGTERVLIGAYLDDAGASDAGAAYLFGTNGALLCTFTNPASARADDFGYSVAAVGTDRVLIGAPLNDTGAGDAGVAYLFSTNGALLTTFTNPTPADQDWFGYCVAAVGTDRVLIGAFYDDTGAGNAGAAYWFSTNGMLLTTFTNPTPATEDFFGKSVAGVGEHRILIGAPLDHTGATDAGAAYLFSLAAQTPEAPSLTIRLTFTNTVAVSWPSPWTGWMLQQNTNGVASVNWSNAPGPFQDDGTTKTLLISSPTADRFYRLFKP